MPVERRVPGGSVDAAAAPTIIARHAGFPGGPNFAQLCRDAGEISGMVGAPG